MWWSVRSLCDPCPHLVVGIEDYTTEITSAQPLPSRKFEPVNTSLLQPPRLGRYCKKRTVKVGLASRLAELIEQHCWVKRRWTNVVAYRFRVPVDDLGDCGGKALPAGGKGTFGLCLGVWTPEPVHMLSRCWKIPQLLQRSRSRRCTERHCQGDGSMRSASKGPTYAVTGRR